MRADLIDPREMDAAALGVKLLQLHIELGRLPNRCFREFNELGRKEIGRLWGEIEDLRQKMQASPR